MSLKKIIGGAFLIGVILHIFIAHNFPFTNDEGAYLYDARVLLEGRLPAGDVLTKSPSVIMAFAMSEAVTHHSLFANRLVNVAASLLMGFIFVASMMHILNKRESILTSMLWFTNGASAIFLSLGHTEPLAALFSVAALGLYTRQSFFLSGLVWALAFSARKTSVAVLPVLLVIGYFQHYKKKQIGQWLGGVLIVLVIWWAVIFSFYGWPGLVEVSGVGYGTLIWKSVVIHTEVSAWGGGVSRLITVFARLAEPLVLLAVASGGYIVSSLVFNWPRRQSLPKTMWIPLTWLLALSFLYALWPTWLPEYAVDFFVPLTLLGGIIISHLTKPWPLYTTAIVLVGVSSVAGILSVSSALKNPWTGMFTPQAVYEAAEVMQRTIPANEPVLTAAVIVPYVSGHHVIGDIAHPYWYRYAFIPEKTRDTFLPSVEDVTTAFNNAQWVVDEDLTNYFYRTDHIPHIDLNGWQQCQTIANETGFRNNPISIWRKGQCVAK